MLYGKSVAVATQHGLAEEDEKLIMLVAPRSTLFQGLAHALTQQAGGYQICFGSADEDALLSSDTFRLVLLYIGDDCNAVTTVEAWREKLGDTPIAVIVSDMASVCCNLEQMLQDRHLQGILPLTLNLEVWLSAVMLLLNGGEFLPVRHESKRPIPEILAVQPNGNAEASPTSSRPGDDNPSQLATVEPEESPVPPPELSKLTHREHEVLELLSQGYQNKLIAHRMSLSQHTVKVHVHNLLAKLRVTNRTQAAAMFRYRPPRPKSPHQRALEDGEGRFAR